MLTRRERLLRSLRGEPVDRPPVCFYEINGYDERPDDADAYNIYTHPSWLPLIELARDHSDRIVMRGVPFADAPGSPYAHLGAWEQVETGGARFGAFRLPLGGKQPETTAPAAAFGLERTRRDRDTNTTWTVEHLIKTAGDLRAFLDLPFADPGSTPDPRGFLRAEADLGDSGLVMVDTADPLCLAAQMFDMAAFTVIALTEPRLFRQVLDKFAAWLLPRVQQTARALPGRLWRIYGPEYASPPYLPPRLFGEYVSPYVREMTGAIHAGGGYARVHCHGNIRRLLDEITATGCDAIDPIEPPPQGDIQLAEVRRLYGGRLTLFGNLEASDLEMLPTPAFREKIRRALREGTAGSGRGFVLMPSSCPYGRELPPLALANYRAMVEEAQAWAS